MELVHEIQEIIMPAKVVKCIAVVVLGLLIGCKDMAIGQSFKITGDKKRVTIPFKLVRNLMVIGLKINDQGPFNFILDSGCDLMIITDPSLTGSLNINWKHPLKIQGLGQNEPYDAYALGALKVSLPGICNDMLGAVILKEDQLGLSNYAGMPVQGLIGYDLFKDLAVKISFSDSTLQFSATKGALKIRRGVTLPLSIEDCKPYLQTLVTIPGGQKKVCKFLLDTGNGETVSLSDQLVQAGGKNTSIPAYLGRGLTGDVDGYICRLPLLIFGNTALHALLAGVTAGSLAGNRDGSIGTELLKHFTLLIDYPGKCITVRQKSTMRQPEYNMSGIIYYMTGPGFHRVVISKIEPGSPAESCGLKIDDELLAINSIPVAAMNADLLDGLFKSGAGRKLKLDIAGSSGTREVNLILKKRI